MVNWTYFCLCVVSVEVYIYCASEIIENRFFDVLAKISSENDVAMYQRVLNYSINICLQ